MGVHQGLRDYKLYRLAREIKWTLEKYLDPVEKVVSLKPSGPSRGDVLLARVNDAFLLKPGEPFPTTHQTFWEAYQQAMVFLELGYAVDVIHFRNSRFVPQRDYALFCDAGWNMERIAPLLGKGCVKMAHFTTAHPLFNNAAELKRLMALQERRGVSLLARRQIWHQAIDYADCATVLGNEFTLNTFRHAGKPLQHVPIAIPDNYPWFEEKDFDRCRNHFLFFAGAGMVHKGLDLVLEAFASMPTFTLTICGPVEKEVDFVRAYHRELYETGNINLAGWVDVPSERFWEICKSCVALLHPSCSEGSSTAVVTCMHAGLIPISSFESGVDVNGEFGVVLKDSSIEEIRESVQRIAGLPSARLRKMAHAAWGEARAEHAPERFVEEFKRVISQVMRHAGLGVDGGSRPACVNGQTAHECEGSSNRGE